MHYCVHETGKGKAGVCVTAHLQSTVTQQCLFSFYVQCPGDYCLASDTHALHQYQQHNTACLRSALLAHTVEHANDNNKIINFQMTVNLYIDCSLQEVIVLTITIDYHYSYNNNDNDDDNNNSSGDHDNDDYDDDVMIMRRGLNMNQI